MLERTKTDGTTQRTNDEKETDRCNSENNGEHTASTHTHGSRFLTARQHKKYFAFFSITMSYPQPNHYPGSPPPLTRSRRSSLTFTASALERFRLPDVSIAATVTSAHSAQVSTTTVAVGAVPRRSSRVASKRKAQSPSPASHQNARPLKKHQPESELCTICMSTFTNRAGLSSCSHFFCMTCIQQWSEQENSCPLCKQRFTHIVPTASAAAVAVTHRNQQSDTLEALLAHLAPTVRWALQARRFRMTAAAPAVNWQAWLAVRQTGRSMETAIEIFDDEDDDDDDLSL